MPNTQFIRVKVRDDVGGADFDGQFLVAYAPDSLSTSMFRKNEVVLMGNLGATRHGDPRTWFLIFSYSGNRAVHVTEPVLQHYFEPVMVKGRKVYENALGQKFQKNMHQIPHQPL